MNRRVNRGTLVDKSRYFCRRTAIITRFDECTKLSRGLISLGLRTAVIHVIQDARNDISHGACALIVMIYRLGCSNRKKAWWSELIKQSILFFPHIVQTIRV